ncbi:MAG: hypothetical protein H7A55_17470 [Verrucomicrobiaceae bacterium]|nr:hypothetical protein [Verrucomicrobiaceae bacterium]
MTTIREIRRLTAPFQRPQGLVWANDTLWMTSLATSQVGAVNPQDWTLGWTTEAPGKPYGLAYVANELRVICGETAEDNRFIRRCVPHEGFDPDFGLPCPDDTGSQLGYDGESLYVSQWYRQRVLRISATGEVLDTYHSPHQICGQVIVGDFIYLMGTDDESTTDFLLTRIHRVTKEAQDIAQVPFQARALAHDGTDFWTNHREAHQTVCFAVDGME